jgi:hypothetical protein
VTIAAAGAQQKLVEIEAKIAEHQVIADTLRATVDAVCDDLITCAGSSCCPIPFATIVQRPPRRPLLLLSGLDVACRRRSLAGRGGVCGMCALPLLLAAGVLSGAGWVVTGRRLPAIAALLIASDAALWWSARRHHHLAGCCTRLDPDNVSHAFSRVARRAGLGHRHLHELRHSGASLRLAQGTDLYVVSEVLGRSSVAITKDVHGHLVQGRSGRPLSSCPGRC